ncbi:unnamed protein product [Rotaria magnacalcarata]|uniref:Uncharacterized protein n=1 Tax=Rotaria magnacalcarata TaxID=392030 RepID=A0A8S2JCM6_9BILA|nr:unnamed protein product [Rotaria magnacalcarata]
MVNLTTAVQRLFDNYDPRKTRNDDYTCNPCRENLKINKFNYLCHLKEWHNDEFEELLEIQRKKKEENLVQQHYFHTQEQHQTNNVLLENEHMNYEHVDDKELTEEDALDLALENISEESNDSSKEPSSIAQYSTSQRTSYGNNIGEILDSDEAIQDKIKELMKMWEKKDLTKVQFMVAMDQIMKAQNVTNEI